MKYYEGVKANDFSLEDKDGNVWKLSELNNKSYVIYFYPKDDTPGCTIEANEFSLLIDDFEKLNCKVIGISGGDNISKKKFCEKHGLKVLLLSDIDHRVGEEYGSYGEKKFMGRTFDGYHRVTFVLDKELKILKVYGKVKAKGHAEEVLELIKTIE